MVLSLPWDFPFRQSCHLKIRWVDGGGGSSLDSALSLLWQDRWVGAEGDGVPGSTGREGKLLPGLPCFLKAEYL